MRQGTEAGRKRPGGRTVHIAVRQAMALLEFTVWRILWGVDLRKASMAAVGIGKGSDGSLANHR